MSPDTIDLETLARHIAVQMTPEALVDASGVGLLLLCSPRRVQEWWCKVPGFPKPLSVAGPDGRSNQPRWMRKQITGWIEDQVDGPPKLGRPRRKSQ